MKKSKTDKKSKILLYVFLFKKINKYLYADKKGTQNFAVPYNII
jgi:hypothetical protein